MIVKRAKNSSEDVSEVWCHHYTILYWKKITEVVNDKKVSNHNWQGKDEQGKTDVTSSVEEAIDHRLTRVNMKKKKKQHKRMTFVYLPELGNAFQRKL